MRIFTKITKVPFSVLRMQVHTSVAYVDDSYLQGRLMKVVLKNVNYTIVMLQSLGFTTHVYKSILKPTQNLIYLGSLKTLKI